jgi:hypothetical protein
MRPEFNLGRAGGVDNSYLEEFAKVIPICLCISTIPETICNHFSFDMNMVAEGVDILSTDGSQVELHASRRCTSASSRIPRMTNRTSQRAAIDRVDSSYARCMDDKDDDDGDDDDINDPAYDQDELMGSQLADAP